LQLTGNVTLTTASPGSVLLIVNGRLDTNGYTLATDATLASDDHLHRYDLWQLQPFAWDSSNTNGGLNLMAPTSGTWKGIALYQNPSLTSGVDFTFAGNKPFWTSLVRSISLTPASASAAPSTSRNTAHPAFSSSSANITISGTAAIEQTNRC